MENIFKKQQKEFWENKKRKQRRPPTNSIIESFVQPKIAYIKKYVKNSRELTLLDVGAGSGFFSYHLEKEFKYLLSTDYSQAMLDINPANNKKIEDATNLSFADNQYDVVFCSNLLHHIQEAKIVVKEMARVSKKYVILHEPNRNNPLMFIFGLIKKEERLLIKYSKKYLEKLTIEADLKIINSRTIGAILPNKTPKVLVPFLRVFDFFPCTFYNMVIAIKVSPYP